MACFLLCFSDDPIEGDERASRSNSFQISMFQGLWFNQPWCISTFCCPACSAYSTRYRLLEGDLSGGRYLCCQGYLDCACFRAGSCGESNCPSTCLCLEACLCPGLSISSSRALVMDMYDIRPDPWDNRLIRFNNCMQLLACVCYIAAEIVETPELQQLASLLDCCANFVFLTLLGCMASQTNWEMDQRRMNSSVNSSTSHIMATANTTTNNNSSADGKNPPLRDVSKRGLLGSGSKHNKNSSSSSASNNNNGGGNNGTRSVSNSGGAAGGTVAMIPVASAVVIDREPRSVTSGANNPRGTNNQTNSGNSGSNSTTNSLPVANVVSHP